MGRRKTDQGGDHQSATWAQIRAQKTFTVRSINDEVGAHRTTVFDYIRRLIAGGYVEIEKEVNGAAHFILVRDAGVHPPRLRRDGTPVQQGSGTQNIWRSMRMLKTFTPADLVIHSTTDTVEVQLATAKKYCAMLLKAGYLRVLEKAVPGGKRQARYRLIRDSGPLPPQIQSVKQVYDQNLRRVMYTPEAR